jgi:hypothetical protein
MAKGTSPSAATLHGDFVRESRFVRQSGVPCSIPEVSHRLNPGMKTLRETFRMVYSDLCDSVTDVDQRLMSNENPFAAARAPFPTSGDFVAYLMTSHLGYHQGQLVGWRAAAGLGRLRRPATLAA